MTNAIGTCRKNRFPRSGCNASARCSRRATQLSLPPYGMTCCQNLITLSGSALWGMTVQFVWPTLQARIEVTYGGWKAISPLEEGQVLLQTDFRFSSDEDEDRAVWDILYEALFI